MQICSLLFMVLCGVISAAPPSSLSKGTSYPEGKSEVSVCGNIRDVIKRNSARFRKILVRNANGEVAFLNDDSRRMTARAKSKLDVLASRVAQQWSNRKLKVIKAWSDQWTSQQPVSLHYEGRALLLKVDDNDQSKLSRLAGLALASGFDWVSYPRNSDYIHASVIRDVCQTSLDMAFILDTSGSVGSYDFEKMKTFVKNIIDFFNIGSTGTHVGVVTYSSRAQVEFNLKAYHNKAALKAAVSRIYYRSGWTYTADALNLVRRNIFQVANGMRPDRGIPKIAVLLTDGYSSGNNPSSAAASLRASGVNVFCIGIGNYYERELNDIATDPDRDHVFKLENFNDLNGWVDTLSAVSCDEGAVIRACDNTVSSVDGGSFLYFRTEFSSATGGISVEVSDTVGISHLYVSLTNKNPGPLDTSSYKNESSISPRSLRVNFQARAVKLVFVAVQGQLSTNSFKLSMWDTLFAQDSYSARVKEGQSTVQDVITLSSSVQGYTLRYSIIDGNTQGRFTIESDKGRIQTTGRSFDHETESRYRLTVLAQDVANACHKGRAVVVVDVEDINDNPPRFARNPYVFSVTENKPAGRAAIVTATDADSGTNAVLRYTMQGGQNKFTISSTSGEIRSLGPLDYETDDSYTLRISASDPKFTVTTQVVMNVIDVNERPYFRASCVVQGNCSKVIAESATLGTLIMTLPASDPDKDSLQYSIRIRDSQDKVFAINAGRITLLKRLDRELKGSYDVIVEASDGRLSAVARLRVVVGDVNDNDPTFAQKTYQAAISEDVSVDTIVKQVTATDADAGNNARLSYSLVSGDTRLFKVDHRGVIRTAQTTFDREKRSSYQIVMRAHDGGSPARTGQTTVDITILDVNDNRPVFTKAQYSVTVDENAPVGTSVVTVQASDADTGINADLRYSITSGNEDQSFSLDERRGYVKVARTLDFERKRSYTLGISVSDRGSPPLTATSRVLISVNDVNDNAPVFKSSVYRSAVRENRPQGTLVLTVSATDRDSTTNGAILYSIIKGNDGGVFSVYDTTGKITIAKPPDFEKKSQYSLTLQARDQGSPVKTDTAQVTILIEDENDHPPVFSQSTCSMQVAENVAMGTVVVTVTATDQDSGPRGQVVYSIASGNVGTKFSIDSSTGVIRVSSPLDREATSSYTLLIEARDGGDPFRTSSARVSITVQDINDNSPVFQGPYVFRVPEDFPTGQNIGSVIAIDADAGQNGAVTYSLKDNTDVFGVDSAKGVITLKKPIDHEKKSTYMVSVTATDSGSPQRSTVTIVKVMVDDVNDNPPSFAKDLYTCTVAENLAAGVAVCYVTATDADSGANAKLAYSISAGNTNNAFTIDRSTGEIKTTSPLDRESLTTYQLTVAAEDGNVARGLSAATTVNINILDENDNHPVFSGMTRFMIREDSSVGTSVGRVTATDSDTGPNGKVTYTVVAGNAGGSFQINAQTGAITVKSGLDREQIAHYTLKVTASDAGAPPQSQTASIVVAIQDVNDNRPKFTQAVFKGTIREDASVASTVLQVKAEDSDEGPNGQITYSLSGTGSANFTIDAKGFVLTKTSLDYETSSSYRLTVTARDGGQPSLSATAQVSIAIINVNDNVPSFVSPAQVTSIREDVAVNTRVVKLNATDSDGTPLTFTIDAGNTGSSFKIDTSSGLISVARRLDRETTANYTLVVKATEATRAGESVYNNATITVLDVNDNAPVFSRSSYTKTLQENLPAGQTVVKVTATDRDEGDNARITYQLTTGDPAKFQVNPTTGLVTAKAPLDREQHTSYTLRVTAKDHGTPSQSSVAVISLTISDVNDNSPQFPQPRYTLTVMENTAIGSNILRVQAADPDEGTNGRVQYSIASGNSAGVFSIDTNTGVISVSKTVDREAVASYSLTIKARDSAPRPRFTDASVSITIADENDNPPVFSNASNTFNINENLAAGSLIAVITATDNDADNNAKVVYSITSGDTKALAIDANTGRLTVKGGIDRETVPRYPLTVRASDRGSPVMYRDRQFVVVVNDLNDNAPVFNSQSYTGHVPENSPKSTSVLTVTADDADTGANAVLRYHIDSGNSHSRFSINASTGIISTTTPLDFEDKTQYVLRVSATDSKYTVTATVTINVINVNDIRPVFSKQSYTAQVRENSPVLTAVVNVSASDRDAFGSLVFSIRSGRNSDKFSVDPRSGVISTADILDREVTSGYTIQVQVTDAGNPPLSNNATVTIDVTDENDNTPAFNKASYSVSIKENIPIRSLIIQVTAADPDLGNNGKITYILAKTDAFTIGATSGVITNIKPIDREAESSYVLYVQAADQGSLRLTSDPVPVHVEVLDVNDNAPRFAHSVDRSVSENAAVGSIVAELQAVDPDLGLGGVVGYEITTTQTEFTIDNTTGIITLAKSLDRETISSYDLEVRARDHGTPSLSSSTRVHVTVLDINDHRPQFNASTLHGSIRENQPQGTHVLRLLATDADTGPNAQLAFTLLSDEHKITFQINNRTGDISTKTPLDREKQAVYTLRVSVSDKGNPSLSSVDDVTIDVIDEDDNCPRFQPAEYNVTISEDLPKGSSILSVTAIDIDGDKDTTYAIKSITPNGGFTIDPKTGTIKVGSAGVDREDSDVFKLVIRAGKEHCGATNDTDGGEGGGGGDTFQTYPSSLATVIVQVSDINDNPPMFPRPFYEYDFNDVNKVDLLTIKATDKDANEYGTVKYRLAGQTEMGGNRVITVEAYDQGSPSKSSNVTVTIKTSVSCEAMVFAITEDGDISTKTLCNFVTTPESNTVIAGTSYTFKCSAKGNTSPLYRWMRNGLYLNSFSDKGDYVIAKLTREDAGVYSCLATSDAGLIQSTAATLVVYERPEITLQPENTSVELGGTARLECRAKGVPDPEYKWFKNNEVIPSISGVESNQPVLVLHDAIAEDEAPYFCMATNDAGSVSSNLATIEVYGSDSLIYLEISVTKPDLAKRCHMFDIETFKATLHKVVEAKITISNYTAEGICEANPCNANPCLHGGVCEVQITMDYACMCPPGWYGKNCEINLNECKGDPCFNNGTCRDREGTYQCACHKGSTGKKCELKKGACAKSNCTSNEVCVLSETSQTGYECKDVINVIHMARKEDISGDQTKIYDLENEIEGLIQSAPDVNNANVTTRRLSRRSVLTRQTTNDYGACAVRIVTPIQTGKISFVLLCPNDIEPQTTSIWVCGLLFKAGKTGSCGASGAMVTPVPPTTLTPIEPMRVSIKLFARDQSGKTLPAEEVIEMINSDEFNTAMKQQGVKFVTARQVKPKPHKASEKSKTGLVVGLVVGFVVAALALALVAAWFYTKKKKGSQHIQLKDRAQMNRLSGKERIIERNVSVKDIARSEKRFVNQAYTDSMCDDDEAEFMVEVNLGKPKTPKATRTTALSKLQEAPWYHGKVTCLEAENLLSDQALHPGTFIARQGKDDGDYVLTVKAPEGGPAYRHLVVKHTTKGTFTAQFGTMPSPVEFNSFDDVIDHFQVTPIEFEESSPDLVLVYGWSKTLV